MDESGRIKSERKVMASMRLEAVVTEMKTGDQIKEYCPISIFEMRHLVYMLTTPAKFLISRICLF